jgi:ABC-type molybdenum transport system ATPase subunit/photorepair protein PhrA
VIGPSGAGKSTLLGALTGMRPATSGGVTYDERDLYTHYDELRHRIGLVPQENILHTQLSPAGPWATPRSCGSPVTSARASGSAGSTRCWRSWR